MRRGRLGDQAVRIPGAAEVPRHAGTTWWGWVHASARTRGEGPTHPRGSTWRSWPSRATSPTSSRRGTCCTSRSSLHLWSSSEDKANGQGAPSPSCACHGSPHPRGQRGGMGPASAKDNGARGWDGSPHPRGLTGGMGPRIRGNNGWGWVHASHASARTTGGDGWGWGWVHARTTGPRIRRGQRGGGMGPRIREDNGWEMGPRIREDNGWDGSTHPRGRGGQRGST